MRDRYVLQVLLATLGAGLLMAVIAVVQTPGDWWQQADSVAAGSPVRAEQIRGTATKNDATSPSVADFKDECEFPFRVIADCPEAQPEPSCDKAGSGHSKKCSERGVNAGRTDHC